jgi:hypothetical protein
MYFAMTEETASLIAAAFVLMVACVSAACVVVVPARRSEAPAKPAPPEIVFECQACGIEYRCTDSLDRPLRCPHCGIANKQEA